MFQGLFGGNTGSVDFGGISEKGKEELNNTIDTFCNDVSDLVNQFDDKAEITKAFKGARLEEAIHDFLSAVKELLNAYVSVTRQNQVDLKIALERWQEADASVKNLADSAAQDIRTEANNIKLD